MGLTGVIEINRLRLFGRHGVAPQERAVGNYFEVTAHLQYPLEEAVATDDVATTLNYAEAVEVIKTEFAVPSRLLEHVAGRIHTALVARFPLINGGMIKVSKLTPPIPSTEVEDVAVKLLF